MQRKTKKCGFCKSEFQPFNSMQKTCPRQKCALGYVKLQEAMKRVKEARAYKAETRRRKQERNANDRNYQIKKLQEDFNRFIRVRDEHKPCISCGRTESEVESYVGGKWDAGHFLSRGGFPELRFEELNCHKQCKTCNGGSNKFARKGRTVAAEYEVRLVERIGQANVDWLKGPHDPKKYTLDEIKELRKHYKAKLKELIKQQSVGGPNNSTGEVL